MEKSIIENQQKELDNGKWILENGFKEKNIPNEKTQLKKTR